MICPYGKKHTCPDPKPVGQSWFEGLAYIAAWMAEHHPMTGSWAITIGPHGDLLVTRSQSEARDERIAAAAGVSVEEARELGL